MQPDEGISLRFEAKLPNTRMQLAPVMMNFRYGTAFGGHVPEAYETLLLDAMLGDATLFARHDFVEASWALITPVHEAWRAAAAPAGRRVRSGRVGAERGRRADGPRGTPMEDAVSEGREGRLLPEAVEVPFTEIEAALARVGQPTLGQTGPRALTGTVVVIGPLDRLFDAADALEQFSASAGIRAILVVIGDRPAPPVRLAGHAVAIEGLEPRFVNNAVAALRLSSLPTLVWWRGGSVESLAAVASLADRLVLDAEDPAASWACVPELVERTAVSDLRWTRLTRWRALMAHFFDVPEVRPTAASFTRLELSGADRPAMRLFAGWLAASLGNPGLSIELRVDAAADPLAHPLDRVRLSNGDQELLLARGPSGRCVEAAAHLAGHAGATRIAALGDQSLAALVAEELRIRSRDLAFERALAAARAIA